MDSGGPPSLDYSQLYFILFQRTPANHHVTFCDISGVRSSPLDSGESSGFRRRRWGSVKYWDRFGPDHGCGCPPLFGWMNRPQPDRLNSCNHFNIPLQNTFKMHLKTLKMHQQKQVCPQQKPRLLWVSLETIKTTKTQRHPGFSQGKVTWELTFERHPKTPQRHLKDNQRQSKTPQSQFKDTSKTPQRLSKIP